VRRTRRRATRLHGSSDFSGVGWWRVTASSPDTSPIGALHRKAASSQALADALLTLEGIGQEWETELHLRVAPGTDRSTRRRRSHSVGRKNLLAGFGRRRRRVDGSGEGQPVVTRLGRTRRTCPQKPHDHGHGPRSSCQRRVLRSIASSERGPQFWAFWDAPLQVQLEYGSPLHSETTRKCAARTLPPAHSVSAQPAHSIITTGAARATRPHPAMRDCETVL
jgi:hypothetical protein